MEHEGVILKKFLHDNHVKVGDLSLELGYKDRNYITNLFKKYIIKPSAKQLLVAKFPQLLELLDLSNLPVVEDSIVIYQQNTNGDGNNKMHNGTADCAAVIAAQAETIAALKAQIADKDEIISLLKAK